MGLAKEYAFNGYEFQGENSRPIDEDTVEIGRHEHISHESEHGQESEQQHEHEHERERGHSHDDDRHEKHHHEHHEHVHLHHTKSISHHPKKPGFSAGSGLRSIAQGSADQASSAVNNQVRKIYFQIDFIEKKKVFYCLRLSNFYGNLQHAAAKEAAFIAFIAFICSHTKITKLKQHNFIEADILMT